MIATHNAPKKVGFSNSSPPISGSLIQHDVGNDQQVNRDAFDLFYYSIRKRMFLGRFTVAERTRFTQTHGARYERWRACKAIWLWHLYTGWMHHIAEHCNQVLQDLKIGLVCAF